MCRIGLRWSYGGLLPVSKRTVCVAHSKGCNRKYARKCVLRTQSDGRSGFEPAGGEGGGYMFDLISQAEPRCPKTSLTWNIRGTVSSLPPLYCWNKPLHISLMTCCHQTGFSLKASISLPHNVSVVFRPGDWILQVGIGRFGLARWTPAAPNCESSLENPWKSRSSQDSRLLQKHTSIQLQFECNLLCWWALELMLSEDLV